MEFSDFVIQLKNRETQLLIITFSVHMIKKYDYAIISPVENVHYSTDETFPCEIALTFGDSQNVRKPFTYHRSNDIKMCEFAERCRVSSIEVQLYGKTMFGQTNVVGIEFAHTKAIHEKK